MIKHLIDIIDTCLENLSTIESALQVERDDNAERAAAKMREWLQLMKKDVLDGSMPDNHIQKCITEIEHGELLRYKCTCEQTVEIQKKYHLTGTNNILSAVLETSNRLTVYKVLRSIGFAQSNSVIVGPNGSGKTTLANCFMSSIHNSNGIVIPAQKLLFIPRVIGIPMPQEIDKKYDDYQAQPKNTKRTYDYRNGSDFPYDMVREFGDEMQNVILKFYAELYQVKTDVFHAVRDGSSPNSTTKADLAIAIWNSLMEERQLFLNDQDHFDVTTGSTTYPAYMMSEGERNMLYLIGRVLFAPVDGYVIVDEPELYLHKTIVNKLWDKLEQARPDCKFIYLTHDLDFAVSRNAEKSWIRKFVHPQHWEIEPIKDSIIPEDLLMRILGSRKKILFCEGTKDSLDSKIFELMFPDYTITPVGSCVDVISYTKAFNNFPNRLADAYGLIDRDCRPEAQIVAFANEHVFAYEVAEVENLFLVEDFLKAYVQYSHYEDALNMELLKESIIKKFETQIEKHATDYVTATINLHFQEQKMHTSKTFEDLKDLFDSFINAVDITKVYEERKAYLYEICARKDYEAVLKAVNNKGLQSEVCTMLGIKRYQDRALEFMKRTDAVKYLRGLFPIEL